MQELHIEKLSKELNLRPQQVRAVAQLLSEGGTVPFIARYRKEVTGSLDEVAITSIRDRLGQLAELDARKAAILKSLEERNLLTEELKGKIAAAETMAALEDLYQPFRPKRRTRAMIAREKGLEPLAEVLWKQDASVDPNAEAAKHVTAADSTVAEDLRVPDAAAALQGARDILAERVNDDAEARAKMRKLFWEKGVIRSEVVKGKDEEGAKFKDYFDWSEPVAGAPSHRVLAIRRGAAEGFLFFQVRPDEGEAVAILEGMFVHAVGHGPQAGRLNLCAEQVRLAVKDSYKRLLCTSMETETRLESKKRAEAAAIDVFAANLKQLLLSSPLGQKRVLAIDPGFRTGCKTVVLDAQGRLIENTVIYPEQGSHKLHEAEQIVRHLVQKHQIEAIAIGNGTASRETEGFVRKLGLGNVQVVMVNESGASVYSASEAAREEFPDQDITVRGAVSIGRRLMDPLAELVKIDPKSIGVGQYQHDVDQDALKKSLDDVVVSAVNGVGVEVNTASKQLLTYVSGLNATIAENIVKHRDAHGAFASRRALLEVPRLGEKTFEQAAGFLRIRDAKQNPLDASAVHPESYAIVEKMAKDVGVSVADLMRDEAARKRIDKQKYVSDKVGLPTLNDILAELAKPGRDPRQQFEPFSFAEGVSKIEDVKPGMKLPGIVTNVTAFGAFVDVGVHQDGLVHISQLADRFVKDPNEVVKVGQKVEVTVMEVDLARRRIGLSMKKAASGGPGEKRTGPAPRSAPAPAKPQGRPTPPPAKEGWFSAALREGKGK